MFTLIHISLKRKYVYIDKYTLITEKYKCAEEQTYINRVHCCQNVENYSTKDILLAVKTHQKQVRKLQNALHAFFPVSGKKTNFDP